MNRIEKLYSSIVGNNLDSGTGIWSVLNPKIKNVLNKYGEYESFIKSEDFDSFSEEEIKALESVTIGWDNVKSIDDISESLYSQIKGIKKNKSLGYYLNIFAGYVCEENYREQATSGGFGTWILQELLNQELVDGVIHVKKATSNAQGALFEYSISSNSKEVMEGTKTKYYPVELSEVLNYVKTQDKKYALIGTPSFIYSVRLLAEQDETFKEKIPYTVGLICGHQKSANYLKSLVSQVGIEYDSLINVDFRKKVLDENADEYIIEFTYEEDNQVQTLTKKMRELVGYSWGQGHFKVKFSDFTDDVMNETADVTLGDAWIEPYKSDGRGTNVLIIRDKVINDLIVTAMEEGRLKLDRLTEDQAYATQPGHFRHTVDELPYRLKKMKKNSDFVPITRTDSSAEVPFLRRRVQDVRKNIRDTSRVLFVKQDSNWDLEQYFVSIKKLEKKYNFVYSLIEIKRLGLKKSIAKAKKRFRNKK